MSENRLVMLSIEEVLSWQKVVVVPKNISNGELMEFLRKTYKDEDIVLTADNHCGTDFKVRKLTNKDNYHADTEIVKENGVLTFKYLNYEL